MVRLWEAEHARSSRELRLATLKELGGAQTIVRTHLDSAMKSLTAEEQDLAAQVFHYLVTPSRTKIAHLAEDLAAYAEQPVAKLTPVETMPLTKTKRPLAAMPLEYPFGFGQLGG